MADAGELKSVISHPLSALCYPSLVDLSGRYQICVAVRNLICVKILYWETQFIIPPNQITVFHPELYEFILIQVGADFRMQRFLEEWLEIDFLALPIVKFQLDTISSQVICFDYINYCIHDLILRVILSGLIDLFKMKKSIHLSTISRALACTNS